MPVTFEVLSNRCFDVAELLAPAMDAVAEHAAETLYSEAVENCPVATGEMRDSHLMEKIGDHWEVSVQKEAALAGEKTYAIFVDFGTIFMQANLWFTNASWSAAYELLAVSELEGI